ncbi:unnamed protein product [marine sediment metagenome]|uniref:Uncharacterized protein n=1 Tax=marine sediment metagenome TaxID=412755 RepID=X1RJ90_9ZZZZ
MGKEIKIGSRIRVPDKLVAYSSDGKPVYARPVVTGHLDNAIEKIDAFFNEITAEMPEDYRFEVHIINTCSWMVSFPMKKEFIGKLAKMRE